MRDALELQIVMGTGRAVVQQQHRAVAAAKMPLERQDLTPVLERVASQHAQFG